MPKIETLKNINVKNKRVLIRVDFNIPLKGKERLSKIEATIPTIRYLIKQKAKIILMSHLGRPGGEVKKNLSLEPIAKELEKLLKKKILFSKNRIKEMKFGDIVMLENIRFNPGEEKNSPKFTKELAALGDVYINEAFASLQGHVSTIGLPKLLPSAMGFLFEKEINELDRILRKPKRPLVVIIGGVKVKIKIKVIEKFFKKADKVIIGGALPNTIFAAHGMEVGKSIIEKDMFKVAEKIDLENPKIQLPVDFVCQNSEVVIRGINAVRENDTVWDMGPRTMEVFLELIQEAKMIVWNGPLGLVEKKPFNRASEILAKTIAKSSAYSIVGGGDTVAFVKKLGLEKKFNYISTGGGAMLEYLANETLPSIKALKK